MDEEVRKLKDIYLEEFKVLKAEQLSRMTLRDRYIYFTIGALATTIAISTKITHPFLLIGIALICLFFGWTYLMNDIKVSHIGEYIRDVLSPRIYSVLDRIPDMGQYLKDDLEELKKTQKIKDKVRENKSLFLWEFFHADDRYRKIRKWFQFFIDFSLFVIPAFVSLSIYSNWFALGLEPLTRDAIEPTKLRCLADIVCIVILLCHLWLALYMWIHADLTKHSDKKPTGS